MSCVSERVDGCRNRSFRNQIKMLRQNKRSGFFRTEKTTGPISMLEALPIKRIVCAPPHKMGGQLVLPTNFPDLSQTPEALIFYCTPNLYTPISPQIYTDNFSIKLPPTFLCRSVHILCQMHCNKTFLSCLSLSLSWALWGSLQSKPNNLFHPTYIDFWAREAK